MLYFTYPVENMGKKSVVAILCGLFGRLIS